MRDDAYDMDVVNEHRTGVNDPYEPPDELECPECGHASVHGKYGCEYERGDAWVTGNQASQPTVLMAMGPCGCRHHQDEPKPDFIMEALWDIARSMKRYGEAWMALGKAGGKEQR